MFSVVNQGTETLTMTMMLDYPVHELNMGNNSLLFKRFQKKTTVCSFI